MDDTSSRLERLRLSQLETDIYIDRYQPCKFLNMIKASFGDGEVISEHREKRLFLTNLDKMFQEIKEKIKIEERHDKDPNICIKAPHKKMNNLKKKQYTIPVINIPESEEDSSGDSSYDDSEDSETDSEDDEGSSGSEESSYGEESRDEQPRGLG